MTFKHTILCNFNIEKKTTQLQDMEIETAVSTFIYSIVRKRMSVVRWNCFYKKCDTHSQRKFAMIPDCVCICIAQMARWNYFLMEFCLNNYLIILDISRQVFD